jgi:hypothetical protein
MGPHQQKPEVVLQLARPPVSAWQSLSVVQAMVSMSWPTHTPSLQMSSTVRQDSPSSHAVPFMEAASWMQLP